MPSRLAEIKAEVMYCMPMATVKHSQHVQSQGFLLLTSFVKVSTDYARGGSVRLILGTRIWHDEVFLEWRENSRANGHVFMTKVSHTVIMDFGCGQHKQPVDRSAPSG